MKSRALGTTGLTVSEIGFGAWGIGGTANHAVAYGATDDRQSVRVLKRAFELGVTFYDTADLYGHGHSERLIGTALKDVRAQVLIASKVGMVDADGTQDFSPRHIRTALEGTLERLQTTYLDLYQLHDPSMELLAQDVQVLATLRRLKDEGKIRAFGVSVRSPEDGIMAVRRFEIPALQVNFNLLDQRAIESGLLALCHAEGVGLIARTPLCFGFLTGAYSAESAFPEDDHRSRWDAQQRALWAQAHRQFSEVKEAVKQTSAQFALRFCLSYPGVSTAIPGMLTEQHVEENVAASQQGLLTQAQRHMIEEIYKGGQFFLGREPRRSLTTGACGVV